ncbi:MAG: Ig-like domain repeat protein, partial [Spirochaetaceae bacterium]|nr:Ig-like domain repeat protein [Spirochaetaceae bacterium]
MNRFFQWLGNIFFLVIPLGGAAWGGYMLWKDINQSFAQINRQPIGRVERTERMVQRQLATRAIWEQAVGGLPLYPEDKIRTGDASAVRIALNSGDVIDLSSNSFITLPSDGEGGIQVESGTVIPVVSSGGLSIQTAGGGSVAEAGEWDFGDDLGSINGGTGVENLVINTIQPTVGLAFSNESFAVDAYMSPSARSTLPVYLTVPAPEAVMGWGLAVRTNDGTLLRTYSGENSRAPPERIEFDGKDDRGRTLPEGAYNWQLSVLYRNGFVSTAVSPPFFVDATPPRAVIKPEYPVFSPNNDGRKDQMVFIQEGTPEVTWRGEIRSASDGAAPVRAVRFTGGLPERFSWNGITDTGAPAPDGDYVYQVFSTDQAGNSGASAPVTFTLSTMETPLRLAADSRAFSPGSRTGRSRITLTPSAEVAGGIASWKIDILNGDGAEVRTFERTGGLPGSVPWDGTLPSGKTAPDGVYTARLTVDYSMGNEPVALSEPFVVDTEPPSGEVALAYRNFSPNGDGRKDTIPFAVTTRGDDSWLAVIRNSAGAEVRSWEWAGEAPLIDWDGTDGAGALAPDGSYTFTLSATDEAGNRSAVPPEALALSTFATPVDIAVNYPAFSPVSQGAQSRITITPAVGVNRGIDSWRMDIIDADGGEVRNFAGTGAVPGSFVWDGASSLGKRAPDGVYAARIRLVYDMGNEPSAWSGPFVVDTVPPEGSVTTGFTVFSPNGDGLKDYMLFTAVTFGDEPWRGEVTDSAGKTVRSWEWTGSAPPLVWDGTDSAGLPAPDGTYAFALSARDDAGNRCERTIPGIRLDARKPTALVTASAVGISPNRASSVRLGLVPSIRDGIESWKLELLGRSGAVFRSFPA